MDDTDVSGVVDDSGEKEVAKLSMTQDELDELIGEKKLKERDKVRREMEAKHKAEIEKLRAEQSNAMPINQGQDNQNIDQSQIDELVNTRLEEAFKKRQVEAEQAQREQEANNIADAFFSKYGRGKQKYEDFEEVMADFDPADFPQLVHAAHGLDNVEDVMYELANDPRKLEKINGWLKNMPERGRRELKKLSDSIRETNAAVDEYEPINEPLSQTKPSNVSAGSGLSKLEQLKQSGKYRF